MDYVKELQAAELHWHFHQASAALASNLYMPGVITFLAAIENSIRSTLYQLKNAGYPVEGELGITLSNRLLRDAHEIEMPIETLALGGEDILMGIKRNHPHVGIVSVRHDLCHGNVQNYINRELGFFTPECLREVSIEIEQIAQRWASGLGSFRAEKLNAA